MPRLNKVFNIMRAMHPQQFQCNLSVCTNHIHTITVIPQIQRKDLPLMEIHDLVKKSAEHLFAGVVFDFWVRQIKIPFISQIGIFSLY